MKKKSRKSTIIIALLLSLVLLALFYAYFIMLDSGGGIISASGKKVGKIEHILSIYGPGRGDHPKFNKPMGVAVDEDKNIYVTDSQNNRVVVFDEEGGLLYEFGGRGVAKPEIGDKADWKPGLFNYPYGIAIEPESGNVYVADMANERIQIFDKKGKFVDWFPKKPLQGKHHAQGIRPTSIALKNDKLYVCNMYQIMIFDLKGNLLNEFGFPGSEPGMLDRPNGIDVGPDGTIYVADSNNLRVQAFNDKGQVKWVIGQKVEDTGGMTVRANPNRKFGLPRNLSVGPDGNIYMMDAFDSQIKVMSPEGKIIAEMGQRGVEDGKFNLPNGIAIADDSTIYVVDKENNRVQVVRLTGFAFEEPEVRQKK